MLGDVSKGQVTARKKARGRVATVAIDSMAFLRPVPVGAVVSCYTQLQDIGRSSMQILVEVWVREDTGTLSKATEGHFTFVAIDDTGRTRAWLLHTSDAADDPLCTHPAGPPPHNQK